MMSSTKCQYAKQFYLDRVAELRNQLAFGDIFVFVGAMSVLRGIDNIIGDGLFWNDSHCLSLLTPWQYQLPQAFKLKDLQEGFCLNRAGDELRLNLTHEEDKHLSLDLVNGTLTIAAGGFLNDIQDAINHKFPDSPEAEAYLTQNPLISS